MIYFVDNQAGQIKIGFAADIEKRLKGLRTASPNIVIFASMVGSRGHERSIHETLKQFRVRGEWFRDCPEVRQFIAIAIRDGVTEWKRERLSKFEPNMWDKRAKRLAEIIIESRRGEHFKRVEAELSLPSGLLRKMKYWQASEVSVSEYFSLMVGAREAIKVARARILRDEAFVSDLEREDADATNKTIDSEKRMHESEARLRALKLSLGIIE